MLMVLKKTSGAEVGCTGYHIKTDNRKGDMIIPR